MSGAPGSKQSDGGLRDPGAALRELVADRVVTVDPPEPDEQPGAPATGGGSGAVPDPASDSREAAASKPRTRPEASKPTRRSRTPAKFWLVMLLTCAALIVGTIFVLVLLMQNAGGTRFLTTSEAQLVAASRFNNFNEGTREVEMRVETPQGTIFGSGYFDYETGAGLARFTSEAPDGTADARTDGGTGADDAGAAADLAEAPSTLIWWTYDAMGELSVDQPAPAVTAGLASLPDLAGLDAEALAEAGWSFLPRDEVVGSPLGALLALTAGYGFDRPDNPKLIEQSDAVWLGEEGLRSGGRGIRVQLPSADVVRAVKVPPVENPALPRVLVNSEGLAVRLEIGSMPQGLSAIDYGRTSQISVPAPEFLQAEASVGPEASESSAVGRSVDGEPQG